MHKQYIREIPDSANTDLSKWIITKILDMLRLIKIILKKY